MLCDWQDESLHHTILKFAKISHQISRKRIRPRREPYYTHVGECYVISLPTCDDITTYNCVLMQQNGYPGRRRSLVDDARFETKLNRDSRDEGKLSQGFIRSNCIKHSKYHRGRNC